MGGRDGGQGWGTGMGDRDGGRDGRQGSEVACRAGKAKDILTKASRDTKVLLICDFIPERPIQTSNL